MDAQLWTSLFTLIAVLVISDAFLLTGVYLIFKRGILFNLMIWVMITVLAFSVINFLMGSIGMNIWTIGASILIGFPLSLMVIVMVQARIIRPIQELSRISQEMAIGRLDIEVSYHRNDEVGRLARAIEATVAYQREMASLADRIANNDLTMTIVPKSEKDGLGKSFVRMVSSLRVLAGEIVENAMFLNTASQQLAGAAELSRKTTNQIANTMQQIAQGTNQQANSISKTAIAANDTNSSIQIVANGANQQSESISKANQTSLNLNDCLQKLMAASKSVAEGGGNASKASKEGANTVSETIQAINQIRSSMETSAKKVKEMGQRSDQIGVIVETIDDIASQTNLLALNAAIEAARAGEQGKGFSVVADEVRKLAERSSQATREIGTLIQSIQITTHEAVSAMNTSLTAVDRGVEKALLANQALESILKTAEVVQNVSANSVEISQQASQAADELINAVDFISTVAKQNTHATQKMTASAMIASASIESIASVSEENSAAVEEVSASTEEMSAQVHEVSTSAQSLADMARNLKSISMQFKLN